MNEMIVGKTFEKFKGFTNFFKQDGGNRLNICARILGS